MWIKWLFNIRLYYNYFIYIVEKDISYIWNSSSLNQIKIVNDGVSFATVGDSHMNQLQLWNLSSQESQKVKSPYPVEYTSLCVDPTKIYLYCGTSDGKINIYDQRKLSNLLYNIEICNFKINDIKYSSKDNGYYIATDDGKICLLTKENELKPIIQMHRQVKSIDYCKWKNILIGSSNNGDIYYLHN